MKEFQGKLEEAKSKDLYLTTFRNIRGQFIGICNDIKEKAYEEAYQEFKNDPSNSKALADGKITIKDIEKYAESKKASALPKEALGVAILIKKYIRFIRIKPANRNQRAPLYFYNPDKGYYMEDNELIKDLMNIITPSMVERVGQNVLYIIGRKSPLKELHPEYTALGNCVYSYRKKEFYDFSPDIPVTRKIETNYNPNAMEPRVNGWKPTKWLKELFEDDLEMYELVIQMFKASITGEPLERIFWLYGQGGTGKGTLQQFIINLVGIDNVASLKITELARSRFTTSILLGKSVVIGDDVQKDAIIKDTSELFSLTTGDIMTIEEKGLKPYSLRLQMTVIQSSNGLPIMDGDKDAITRRLMIIPFTSKYKNKPNKAIKKYYIARKDVLEYILKLAIETPTKEVYPKTSRELVEAYLLEINPVLAFIEHFFTNEINSEFIPNSFVWHVWKNYIDYYNLKSAKTETALHRELKANLPKDFTAGQRMIPKGREHHVNFFPKDDLPHYATHDYGNGRAETINQTKPKNERGYWNCNFKKK